MVVLQVVSKGRGYKDALLVEDTPRLRSYGPHYNFEATGADMSWMGAWVDVDRCDARAGCGGHSAGNAACLWIVDCLTTCTMYSN